MRASSGSRVKGLIVRSGRPPSFIEVDQKATVFPIDAAPHRSGSTTWSRMAECASVANCEFNIAIYSTSVS